MQYITYIRNSGMCTLMYHFTTIIAALVSQLLLVLVVTTCTCLYFTLPIGRYLDECGLSNKLLINFQACSTSKFSCFN